MYYKHIYEWDNTAMEDRLFLGLDLFYNTNMLEANCTCCVIYDSSMEDGVEEWLSKPSSRKGARNSTIWIRWPWL